ncbi:MAG: DUF4838 domain-containing protein [Lentisphaerae bacterium]|nr:DUF4838 domain-containing protein [Lentisphaerota bacterium]
MLGKMLILVLAITSGLAARSAGQPLVLVEGGVSRAPIVVSENASPATIRVAGELAGYIAKISGARPEILASLPDPLPERAIWVGCQPVLAALFPGLDLTFAHPEEILIAANDRHLLVAGRDVWDPEHLLVAADHYQFGNQDVPDFQSEYGTVNAVYTFLHDYLDVRWLWPGSLGEDILPQATIAFEPFTYRYHPQIRQRQTIISSTARYRPAGRQGTDSASWACRQRLQLDSLYAPVQGHGFSDWWARYHKDHPDYFALQPDGTRNAFPTSGNAKICEANPAVWQQWVDDVAQTLERHPMRTVFSAAANDSWMCGHCVCDLCRAWDHPEGEMRRFVWRGLSENYVAPGGRAWLHGHQSR